MDTKVESAVIDSIKDEVPPVDNSLASYLPRVDQFYIPEWLTMQFIANNLMSFTPLFSYGTTIISIERCQTALGFSIDICATMLIASILRISYYLITPYEITLLRQSLVMIFIQLILLRTSLKYRPDEYIYENLKNVESFAELMEDVWLDFYKDEFSLKNFSILVYRLILVFVYKFLKFFDPNYKRFCKFWQWQNDTIFWKFLAYFATLQIFITFIISKVLNWDELAQWLGSLIGSLGLLVESLLPLPQIAILYKLKSVQGFKLILLVSWLCGDTLKITYLVFGAKNISILFFLFAFFQMSLDFYIGGQYIYYKYYYDDLRHHSQDIEMDTMSIGNENREYTPNMNQDTHSRSRTITV
ncbi:hypothetical protein KAFR_0K00840 [Kazachstania africana CBS 2517]|uniref:PQ-loop repeat-containing protein 1 n=1 Tax=Kazachstania africana (strain ATCC 22294 / BCRC 22015 / CBS 2517 / CECT 1963 / NBRC 1671 / NRRL Y-8276) TaxID=1071382 RepID=H2B1D9_KAZAF|nr:hypothetical protein KAFR_0K00840 [Kazachstania africana CBS 2517]CCF60439.1 hypothetical protein KAFR_0K00840 [Kazachstania africana CBS 2517]